MRRPRAGGWIKDKERTSQEEARAMSRRHPWLPFSLLLLGAAAWHAGTARGAEAEEAPPPGSGQAPRPVAVVNGTTLTEADLLAYARSQGRRGARLSRRQALRGLVDRELLYQEALQEGLDRDPAVAAELRNQERNLLAGIRVDRLLRQRPVSEEELRRAYRQRYGQGKLREYKARHILVRDEATARKLIEELEGGADFAALAREHSVGPSARQGGDLGWFSAASMVPPFAEAVQGLAKGAYTKEPVRTRFGWHVILLEDTREVDPPAFEEVAGQLRAALQSRALARHLEALRRQAEIRFPGAGEGPEAAGR